MSNDEFVCGYIVYLLQGAWYAFIWYVINFEFMVFVALISLLTYGPVIKK